MTAELTENQSDLLARGIDPHHAAFSDYANGECNFESCLQRFADVNKMSRAHALLELTGKSDEIVPPLSLSQAEQRKLDEAAALTRKAESASAERAAVVAEWSRRTAAIEKLRQEAALVEREIAGIKAGIAKSMACATGRANPDNLNPVMACHNAAAYAAALPAFQTVLDDKRAQLSAAVREARAYGKANGVQEGFWPADDSAIA